MMNNRPDIAIPSLDPVLSDAGIRVIERSGSESVSSPFHHLRLATPRLEIWVDDKPFIACDADRMHQHVKKAEARHRLYFRLADNPHAEYAVTTSRSATAIEAAKLTEQLRTEYQWDNKHLAAFCLAGQLASGLAYNDLLEGDVYYRPELIVTESMFKVAAPALFKDGCQHLYDALIADRAEHPTLTFRHAPDDVLAPARLAKARWN